MTRALDAFRTYLRGKGASLTPQRLRLVKRLLGWRGHFSAEEIITWAARQEPPIARATVYRTLPLLRDAGLLLEHEFGTGPRLFEASFLGGHHDHMICVRCGSIREFHSPAIERLQNEEIRRAGFTMLHHEHRIFGLCAPCSRGGAGRDAPKAAVHATPPRARRRPSPRRSSRGG